MRTGELLGRSLKEVSREENVGGGGGGRGEGASKD